MRASSERIDWFVRVTICGVPPMVNVIGEGVAGAGPLPFPARIAGRRVERGDQAAVNVAADLHDDRVLDQGGRRRCAAEELREVDQLRVVLLPETAAGLRVPGVQDGGGAEGEEAVADDQRRCVGTFAHPGGVLVLLVFAGVGLLPELFAGGEVEGGDDLPRVAPAVDEDTAAGDYRGGVAFTNLRAPYGRVRRGPAFRGCREHTVARGTAPLRPVLGESGREKDNEDDGAAHVAIILKPLLGFTRLTYLYRLLPLPRV